MIAPLAKSFLQGGIRFQKEFAFLGCVQIHCLERSLCEVSEGVFVPELSHHDKAVQIGKRRTIRIASPVPWIAVERDTHVGSPVLHSKCARTDGLDREISPESAYRLVWNHTSERFAK